MQRCIVHSIAVAVVLFLLVVTTTHIAIAASKETYGYSDDQKIIGSIQRHLLKPDETLLDVARSYDLGFNEIEDLYPGWDPWLPPYGTTMNIPSQWILPGTVKNGIIVNLAELRLYYFDYENGTVITFPIAIGDRLFPSPEGEFKISSRIQRPTWTVPPSLRGKYKVWTVPAGEDNPLGEHWLGLGDSHFGIHGTNFPWSIGRLSTNGCIRLYPEDMGVLFDLVQVGTLVKIIYEPVKITTQADKVYLEIHKDVYGKIRHFPSYAMVRLHKEDVAHLVDFKKFQRSLQSMAGIPVNIARPAVVSRK
jgi:L,D-transpeptidase ErfK/SrfK